MFLQLDNDGTEKASCKFDKVVKGSVLSYQVKPCNTLHSFSLPQSDSSQSTCIYPLPVLPKNFIGPVGEQETAFLDGLAVTLEQSREYEQITRSQAQCREWHKLRQGRLIASVFKRIQSRKADFTALAVQLAQKRAIQTAAMKHAVKYEADAATTNAETFRLEEHSVGLVLNPPCPHVGCSPDRIVYDDREEQKWGLLEMKCPVKASCTECEYLKCTGNIYRLKRTHQYYIQVMGQMGITGLKWCDFFVYYHRERIYFSETEFDEIKVKLDIFYFEHCLPHIVNKSA